MFITPRAQELVNSIFGVFDMIFSNFKFLVNASKCYKSPHPAIKHCFLPVHAPDEKYLGIYLEQEPATYLKYVESAIAAKHHQIPDFVSLARIESVIQEYKSNPAKERLVKSLRGIFQYRLRPFASTREEYNAFFQEHNMPNIADCLF